MVFRAMTGHFLFVILIAYVLNDAYCQFAGRRYNIANIHFRPPIHTSHGIVGGQGALRSFLMRGFSTSVPINFGDTHLNISQGNIRHGRHPQAKHKTNTRRLHESNIHSSFNEPNSVSLHRQNSFPNQIGYTAVSNSGRSNEQSRTILPVHSIQNVQNARLKDQSRGIVTEARHNNQNQVGNPRNSPARKSAVSERQISGNRHMPLIRSLSNEQVASYNTQTELNVPGRTSWSTGVVSASRPHRVARPLQTPVLHNLHRSAHIPTRTILGTSVLQTRLAENREQPHHHFHSEQNEAFQYRTSISRAPTVNQHDSWNNQPRFSGSSIASLTLPFEPLSLRYKGLKDSNKAKQNSRDLYTAKNINEKNPQRTFNAKTFQTGLQERGDPRSQAGIQFVGGSIQQSDTQYRDSSVQIRPQFNNIRRPLHSFNIARLRQGHLFPRRHVQTAGRSLHEVLGISTEGLQDAVRSSMPEVTKTRHRNPNARNVQVVRNQSGGLRRRINNGSQHSKNSTEQSQAKADLIADITRTLSLADRLTLFGEELGDNWGTTDAQSDNARDRPIPQNSHANVSSRLNSDANDSDDDDSVDRLATPNVSRGIPFPGQSARVFIVAKNDYNDDDNDDDDT